MRRRLGALLLGTAVLLLSFQNCGKSNFASSEEENILTSAGVNLEKNTEPTAFDVGLDMITYNSCVPNVRGAAGYFTMKASAGGTRGGIRLDPQFLNSASTQLRPIFGNTEVLDVQYKQFIEETNPEAEVQLALRATSDYRDIYLGASKNGIWGFNDMIGDDAWLTPLVDSARRRNNQWLAYSNRAPSSKSRFDFSFNQEFGSGYWENLGSAQNFRSCVSQGCQGFGRFSIALGFSEPMDKTQIRGPASTASDQSYAYGRGYLLQFGYPGNRPENGMRVVKGIQEYNMATQNQVLENNVPTQWSCMEIPIMSSVQRGSPSAPQMTDSDCSPMPGDIAVSRFAEWNLAKLREVLPSHQWRLGVTGGSRLCAVPVGFDCYPNEPFLNYQTNGSTQPYPYYVAYNNESCINEDNLYTELSKTGVGAPNRVCGHYVTVCTKQ